jgi:hypothetical protein
VVAQGLPHRHPVSDLDGDTRFGVLLTEAGDDGQDQPLGGGGHRDEPNRSPCRVFDAAGAAGAVVEEAEAGAHVIGEGRSGRSEAEAAAVAGDERHPQLPLEAGDRGRDGRLGDEERLGSDPDRPRVGHREKRAELAQRHGHEVLNVNRSLMRPRVAPGVDLHRLPVPP